MKRHILIGALAALPGLAAAQPFPTNEQNGVRWTCAGVGEEEREALAKLEPQSNLKIVFVAGPREYTAGVEVAITDASGKIAPVRFVAEGPICLVQAPAGRFSIEAVQGDAKRVVTASAPKQAKQPAKAVVQFPAEKKD